MKRLGELDLRHVETLSEQEIRASFTRLTP
jgi:hypothetical protein